MGIGRPGLRPRHQHAWMDGTNIEVFVSQIGLTMNYSNKMYGCDVHLGRIERIGLDGHGREVQTP